MAIRAIVPATFLGQIEMFSRRTFLAGAGALALTAITEAHEHVAKQIAARDTNPLFYFFTPAEAKEMEAVCAQIIPTDDSPGAREAGCIYFIDYAVGKLEPDLQPIFRDGLKQLSTASAPKNFSDHTTEEQITILKKLEPTEFFAKARAYTIIGFLGDPSLHGNRDKIGWKHIQFDDSPMYEPPFGYYDAELLKGKS